MDDEHEDDDENNDDSGLSGTRQLENCRMESMRHAQANLSRQTRSRLVTSAISRMRMEKDKAR